MLTQVSIDPAHINYAGFKDCFLFSGEREVLITLLRSVNAKRIVEFGVNEGKTAKTILVNIPTVTHYLGIDVPFDYMPELPEIQKPVIADHPGRYVADDPRFTLLLRTMRDEISAADIGSRDVAFIDGDHSEAGVREDTELALACVRPGGIIIWHDYWDAEIDLLGVRTVLQEYASKGHDILRVRDTCLAFLRVI